MASSSPISVCVATGSHCDHGKLKQFAQELCKHICVAHIHARNLTDRAFSTTAWHAQDSSVCVTRGVSWSDLRTRSQIVKSCDVYCPIVDLSVFMFDESLCELYYALRAVCTEGTPVVVPVIDADLLHVATALRRRLNETSAAVGVDDGATKQPSALLPRDETVERVAQVLSGTSCAGAILNVLPWILNTCFVLTTEVSAPDAASKLINFVNSVVADKSEPLDAHSRPTVWDLYSGSYIGRTGKKPNSAIRDIFVPLSAESSDHVLRVASLNVANCALGDAGIVALAECICWLPSLESLHVDGNNMSDVGCAALCRELEKHLSVASISFRDNRISDGGLSSIYFLLEGNPRICTVHLEDNTFASKVWQKRIQASLNRNQQLKLAADTTRQGNERFGARVSRLVAKAREVPKLGSTDNKLTLEVVVGAADAKEGDRASQASTSPTTAKARTVRVSLRLEGSVAARAAEISQPRSARGEEGSNGDGRAVAKPVLQLEFDVPPSEQLFSKHEGLRKWSSSALLCEGAHQFALHSKELLALNIARLNGDKLPLLFSGLRLERVDAPGPSLAPGGEAHQLAAGGGSVLTPESSSSQSKLASGKRKIVGEPGASSTSPTDAAPVVATWAAVTAQLLSTSPDERRRASYIFAPLRDRVQCPTGETILLLAWDLVLQQKNIFSTALRSLVTQDPVLPIQLRIVSHSQRDDDGAQSPSTEVIALTAQPSSSRSSSRLAEADEFFTESEFIGVVCASSDTSTLRFNRPHQSADVDLQVMVASSTMFYRPLITRCSGTVDKEISGLLKLHHRQQTAPELCADDQTDVQRMKSAASTDLQELEHHDDQVKARVTAKWGAVGATKH